MSSAAPDWRGGDGGASKPRESSGTSRREAHAAAAAVAGTTPEAYRCDVVKPKLSELYVQAHLARHHPSLQEALSSCRAHFAPADLPAREAALVAMASRAFEIAVATPDHAGSCYLSRPGNAVVFALALVLARPQLHAVQLFG
jgi:hypothetical protein